MRAALYLRVSTARQAVADLSIPDQRRQLIEYCERKGWAIVREFVEPGASAMDDKRPEFQRMIEEGSGPARPFDAVLVHSQSRFFRDVVYFGLYRRQLEKNGVRLVSITQDVGDSPSGRIMSHIYAAMDEHSSAENSKHTLRAMQENARQGFWNGARPPFGYKLEVAEQRGQKPKKRLAVEPREAEIVRNMFHLYQYGDNALPMGIKRIVCHLNERGIRNREEGKFTAKTVHEMLTRTTYIGRHQFNKRSAKGGRAKSIAEIIEVACPRIVDEAAFLAVQQTLKSRNPKRTPPRVVNGPCLLTGLAHCASCGGGMTLRTGKGGRYRYYTCLTCVRMGKTACKGRSVRMDYLDTLVLEHFEKQIAAPTRLKTLLEELASRLAKGANQERERLIALQREEKSLRSRITSLYEAIESKAIPLDDMFKTRFNEIRARLEETQLQEAALQRRLKAPRAKITPDRIEEFSKALCRRLRDPDSRLRKGYLRLFVDRIEVDDSEVRIAGPKAALYSGAENPTDLAKGPVPSFDRQWRPLGDSNPWYRRERWPCRMSAANGARHNSLK